MNAPPPTRLLDRLTGPQRLMLLTAAAVLIVLVGASLFTSPDPTGPSTQPPPPTVAGWQPEAARFARAYQRYLTGKMSARRLPATARVREIAASAGPIPERSSTGPSVLSAVTAIASPGEAVRATFAVSVDDTTYPLEIALADGAGTWRTVDLVPPDFATITAPPATAPTASADLQRSAAAFARRYLRYASGDRSSWPATSPTLRRQIRSGTDPLPQLTADRSAAKHALRYGPPQGNTVTVTATVDSSTPTAFSFVMRKSRGRWQPFAFVTDNG